MEYLYYKLNLTTKSVIFQFMTGKEFKIKRVTLDLTQAELGKELDISSNTISRYETEDLLIPKTVELALEALEARQVKEIQKQIEASNN